MAPEACSLARRSCVAVRDRPRSLASATTGRRASRRNRLSNSRSLSSINFPNRQNATRAVAMSDETGAGSEQVVVTEEAMKPHSVHGVQHSARPQHQPDSAGGQIVGCSPPSTAKGGDSAEEPRLWSAFWQEFSLEDVPHERCHIPGDGRYVVDQHWAHFANILPRGAQVIDLGCGAGIVGRTLLGHRSDLRVTGVDFANVPTPAVENLTILLGVRMEALPFNDRRFDAAISLFGIEYG